ncbi:uncharacterized protein LOC142326213 [Lycorma delicatula]|uniref:uncharacterized protein LOC142326213 n=1 Tax=Lycorma delicatula TaxID=130591 RepID=UPI003F50EF9F
MYNKKCFKQTIVIISLIWHLNILLCSCQESNNPKFSLIKTRQVEKSLLSYYSNNERLIPVIRKLQKQNENNKYGNQFEIMKLVHAVNEKFKWSQSDIEKYIQTTKDAFSGTFEKPKDLLYFVKNVLLAPETVDKILKIQEISKNTEHTLNEITVAEIFKFRDYVSKNWKLNLGFIDYIQQMKNDTKNLNIYMALIREYNLTRDVLEKTKNVAKKFKGDFINKLKKILSIRDILGDDYGKVLDLYFSKNYNKFSLGHVTELANYYKAQNPKMDDKTLEQLGECVAKNKMLNSKLLAVSYYLANKYKLNPSTLIYIFNKNDISIRGKQNKYLFILTEYGLANKYPETEIEAALRNINKGLLFIYKTCKKNNWSKNDISRYIYESFKKDQSNYVMLNYLNASNHSPDVIDKIDHFGGVDVWLALKKIGLNYKFLFNMKNKGYNALPLILAYINVVRSGFCDRLITEQELEESLKYGKLKFIEKTPVTNNTKRTLTIDFMTEVDYHYVLKEICQNKSIEINTVKEILKCAQKYKPKAESLAKFIHHITAEKWYSMTTKYEEEMCKYPYRILQIIEGVKDSLKLSENEKDKIIDTALSNLQIIENIFALCEDKKYDWPDHKTINHIIDSLILGNSLETTMEFLIINPRLSPKTVRNALNLKPKDYWKTLNDHGFSDFDAVLALIDHSRTLPALEIYKKSDCNSLQGDKLVSILNCDYPVGKFNDEELKDLFNYTCLNWSSHQIEADCDLAIKVGDGTFRNSIIIEGFKNGNKTKLGLTHWTLSYSMELINYVAVQYKPKQGWESLIFGLEISEMRYLIFITDHNEKKDVFNFIYTSLKKGLGANDMVKYVELTKYYDAKYALALLSFRPYENLEELKTNHCDMEEIATVAIEIGNSKLNDVFKLMKQQSKIKMACSRIKLLQKILYYDKKNQYKPEDLKTYLIKTEDVEEDLLIELFNTAKDSVIPADQFLQLFEKDLGNYLVKLQNNKKFLSYFHKNKGKGSIINLFEVVLEIQIKPDILNKLFESGGETFTRIAEREEKMSQFFNKIKDLNSDYVVDIMEISQDRSISRVITLFNTLQFGLLDMMKQEFNEHFKSFLKKKTIQKFETLEILTSICLTDEIEFKTLDNIFRNGGSKVFDLLILNNFWSLRDMIVFINENLENKNQLIEKLFDCTEKEMQKLLDVCKKWNKKDFENYLLTSLNNKKSVDEIQKYASLADNYSDVLKLQAIGSYQLWYDIIKKSEFTAEDIIRLHDTENHRKIKNILEIYKNNCQNITKQMALLLLNYYENNNITDDSCLEKGISKYLTIVCKPNKFIGTDEDKHFFEKLTAVPEKLCLELRGISAYRNGLDKDENLSLFAEEWIKYLNENNWNLKQIMSLLKVSTLNKIKPHIVNEILKSFTGDIFNDLKLGSDDNKFQIVIDLLRFYNVEETHNFLNIVKTNRKISEFVSHEKIFKDILINLNERKYPFNHMKSIMVRYSENADYLTHDQLVGILKLKNDFKVNEILHCIEEAKNEWWKILAKKNTIHPCVIAEMVESENSLITLDVLYDYAREEKCTNMEIDVLKQIIKYSIKYFSSSVDLQFDFKYLCDAEKWNNNMIRNILSKALEYEYADLPGATVPSIFKTFTSKEIKDVNKTIKITSSILNENNEYPDKEALTFIKHFIKCDFKIDELNLVLNYYPKSKSRQNKREEIRNRFILITNRLEKIANDNCSIDTFKKSVTQIDTDGYNNINKNADTVPEKKIMFT